MICPERDDYNAPDGREIILEANREVKRLGCSGRLETGYDVVNSPLCSTLLYITTT
jgi:hypothetical protein